MLLKHDEEIFDPLFAPGEIIDLDVDLDESVLLGFEADETPVLAAWTGVDREHLPHHIKAIELRSVYVQGLVPPDRLGAIAQASALVSWNRTHHFCSRCGAESDITDGGYKRVCPKCQTMHFPRTDPVVIMLAVTPDNDKCLLGRGAHFNENMYSCLAGFVEPGETIEDAVRRETRRGIGHPGRQGRLLRQPALALSAYADDRLSRGRGDDRHKNRRRTGRLPLVQPRRSAADAGQGASEGIVGPAGRRDRHASDPRLGRT